MPTWTPFEIATIPPDKRELFKLAHAGVMPIVFLNSRYQVNVVAFNHPTFGKVAHLSIKALDKSASHDWRDFQRIKNEIVGPECEAIEIYPAESRLVDGANQYHLWAFQSYQVPLGFNERLVAEGCSNGAVQRPFEDGSRPDDLLTADEVDAKIGTLYR